MELKSSSAKQAPGNTHPMLASSDAKFGCDEKTLEHKRQEEVRGWNDKAQGLQQQSTQLTAQLAAAHLDIRKQIILVMITVLVATLLWFTEPYYESCRPAAYTAGAIFGATVFANFVNMLLAEGKRFDYMESSSSGKYRSIIHSSTVISTASSLVNDLDQIATDDKSCDGRPCRLLLPVRQLQKQAEVWKAHNQALCKQEERNNLLQELRTAALSRQNVHFTVFAFYWVVFMCTWLIRWHNVDLKDLALCRRVLLQLVPAAVLLGWVMAFKGVKAECKRLLDESKRLSQKAAKTVCAKGCAEELA